jgi:hypothetical protein
MVPRWHSAISTNVIGTELFFVAIGVAGVFINNLHMSYSEAEFARAAWGAPAVSAAGKTSLFRAK